MIAGAVMALSVTATGPALSPPAAVAAPAPATTAPAGAERHTDPKLLKAALLAQADMPEGYELKYGPDVMDQQFRAEMGVCEFGTEPKGEAVAVKAGSVTFSKVLDDLDVSEELLDIGADAAAAVVVDAVQAPGRCPAHSYQTDRADDTYEMLVQPMRVPAFAGAAGGYRTVINYGSTGMFARGATVVVAVGDVALRMEFWGPMRAGQHEVETITAAAVRKLRKTLGS
ncbi:hypothetical protein Ate01nite_13820 [Actinoplanes teichomyceticus]|nr:hypothetical protein Ate01nite_13820 [Actinoplanes teichomyceticus]